MKTSPKNIPTVTMKGWVRNTLITVAALGGAVLIAAIYAVVYMANHWRL